MATDRIMDAVERYLTALREAAGNVPRVARDEFIKEIRSHILDHTEAEKELTESGLQEILRRVGDPGDLARQLSTQAMLRRAAKSFSPWVLLRSTLGWAMRGIAGVFVFFLTALGYGCAAVSYLVVLLKPLFPGQIGLWLGPEHTVTLGFWNGHIVRSAVYGISLRPPANFVLGTLSATDGPVRELAGQQIYLIAVVCGAVFVVATTLLARWLITRFGLRPGAILRRYNKGFGHVAQMDRAVAS